MLCRRALVAACAAVAAAPAAALEASGLAVVINADDPLSVETGVYYARARGVPVSQVFALRLGRPRAVLERKVFDAAYARLNAELPDHVQALVLSWTEPYRAGCMSITSAFAFGYDRLHCADGCQPTAMSPYYASESLRPFDDYEMRPAMSLAGESFVKIKRVIDRGVRADGSNPAGVGYLLSTGDRARNVRAARYQRIVSEFGDRFRFRIIQADRLRDRFDVMFYFTGLKEVPHIRQLGYRPGAIADHLTSAGGRLTGSKQMSALEWLEAGATGSYGTVVEPCNFPQKFPDPYVVVKRYLAGETLIEAYWKSVAWPGQGVFIGEPLARPFPGPGHR